MNNPAPFSKVVVRIVEMLSPPAKDETTKRMAIAIKSCTNKNPIEILPYSFSRASLSESNFIIIIVEEKDNAIAI